MTPLTRLADLRGGAGIDQAGMRITTGLTTYNDDLSAATTVEDLINADSRQSLIAHTRALDRVLLWGRLPRAAAQA